MEIIDKISEKRHLGTTPPVTIAFLGDSVTQGCFELFSYRTGGVDTVFESGSSYTGPLFFQFGYIPTESS